MCPVQCVTYVSGRSLDAVENHRNRRYFRYFYEKRVFRPSRLLKNCVGQASSVLVCVIFEC